MNAETSQPVNNSQQADSEPTAAVADMLRRLGLDEGVKARVLADPLLGAVGWQVARRYVAGQTMAPALDRVRHVNAAGHTATVDFIGESSRDQAVADAATAEFLRLVQAIRDERLRCSVSLDLSHIGSVVDRDLGLANAGRIAAAASAAGIEMVLSMEGADRVEQILGDHAALCARFDNVGVTVQARLHRTFADLDDLLARPGRIRLVKGAYDTPPDAAITSVDKTLPEVFDSHARRLLRSGHPCSIATHDLVRLDHVDRLVRRENLGGHPYRIEMLFGLGAGRLDGLRERDHPTQEYVVYGTEWWLYLCNRLAEDPRRLFDAVADLVPDVERS
ncbi:proline dehydrogenase family protein [Actinokineospora sp.]|uniref:proline dehydrogenase family protein n=1 Tax=Actinokineospora sp. TaxID=1872133 RepID=UPI00403763D6